MPFSCTVCDRFGDIWRYENFVHIKNLALYTQGKVDMIFRHIFLFDHNVIKKCVWKPNGDSHMTKHMNENHYKKKTIAYFFILKKDLKSTRKKQYLQDILKIFLINFLHFSRNFKIMYVFLNIQSQFKAN